ncbi:hypothetical protein RU820_06055 [Acidithiobacillus ferrooxidans]|uniref:Uncharacterized protein n=1 Tax=Acidithiobacillus ferrooxidans (strain ATCC 23270 / DSM 14882 / CIP 104768 / NCIMB 8455) TaxID=243159 RepID=B7J8V4_ACIF2|nr:MULTISPECIES: hypothetical protein [Acidithiobacillus]ACK80341.1 hypothetical protein AFE_1272 [Acidithiobacillus ferrooxidans ATCC 23270]MBN6744316.1 hypothetical protein [Acidithiobacillus sp. MC2.2]MBN6747275.1 hypothetical protein [Acidithiobacillus sp. PG05]
MSYIELFAGGLYPSKKRVLKVVFNYDHQKDLSVYTWSRQTGIADLSIPDYIQILQSSMRTMWVTPGSREERDLASAIFVAVDGKRGRIKMQDELSSTIAWAEMRHKECAPHQAAFRSACEVAKGITGSWAF